METTVTRRPTRGSWRRICPPCFALSACAPRECSGRTLSLAWDSWEPPTLCGLVPLDPRCARLLHTMRLVAKSKPVLAAARVQRRSLLEPGLPRPLLSSTTSILTCGSEAKSSHPIRQALQILRAWIAGSRVSPPTRGVSPSPFSAGCHPLSPICGDNRREPLLNSSTAEVSITLIFTVFSIWISRVMGKCGSPGSNATAGQVENYPWVVDRDPKVYRSRQTKPLPFITWARY